MSRSRKKDYPKKFDPRRFDHTCRNHGGCGYCLNNRIFFDKKARNKADKNNQEIESKTISISLKEPIIANSGSRNNLNVEIKSNPNKSEINNDTSDLSNSIVNMLDSLKVKNNKSDSTKSNPNQSTKRYLVGVNLGLAFNNFTFTNQNFNLLNLFTFGIHGTYEIKNNFYFKSLLNISSEALDIEYYDYFNNNYRSHKASSCQNIQLAILAHKKTGNWGIDVGPYLGYILKLNGKTQYFKALSSNESTKRIDVYNLISSSKLDKTFINQPYFRKLDYGLQLGINYQFNKVNLGFSYAQGLRDFINYENYYKRRNMFNPHRNIFVTIGFKLN